MRYGLFTVWSVLTTAFLGPVVKAEDFGDDHRQIALCNADSGVSNSVIFTTDSMPSPVELPKADVAKQARLIFKKQVQSSHAQRRKELAEKNITIDDKTLKWKESTYGERPKNGHSLWISMHGGGGAPAIVNDRQWENQVKLYQPKEGIYIAPRAPTDTWDLWHQNHIDPLFARLIENHIAVHGVDPNRVYIMGYSAGGDGVWQLAPRMADRFAAASMMAGHPNEASLLGLRNLPFAIFMGGNDRAYKRNTIAANKAKELDELRQADPDGYVHLVRIYEGLGHWMNRKDQEALPWMASYERQPWPKKIIWYQDNVTHDRFYWLKIPEGTAKKGTTITATVNGQHIELSGEIPTGTRIRLSDNLLDLDQDVQVSVNNKAAFSRRVHRSIKVLEKTLAERLDLAAAASAEIILE
ncbi:Alpha/beta hydrolase family protein [Planctomycetes bacterium CA13]|uniref:Alpha/beta hydrolase family protein n=1 Tax=Novipirellula herctigrandis TaxID=2527986 RepID=A0A5C5Z1M5_9BACT|nr:Alpha/beta hydrolase family protein [Planctomycetes bacterium CA13]